MRIRDRLVTALTLACSATWLVNPLPAQEKGGQPAPAATTAKADVDPGQPGENHKLLAELVGSWDCKMTLWMAPGAPPSVSLGTAVRKPVMDGHYFVMDTAVKMPMPGPDGQNHLMDYKGMEIDGYDNGKGKFFSTWIDNMGTGTLSAEGSYDPASKTFTYYTEEEMVPGTKTKVRGAVKLVDKDHYLFDWYEERGGKEEKTMEIAYTRQK